jgi:hypothetical protein
MRAVITVLQTAAGTLPAAPPIDGWVWSYAVPAALLAVAAGSTWMLYRRFSRLEDHEDRGGHE